MHKQLFFIISLYLITYSFSADTDPCAGKTDSATCKADTTNNCEWTETKAASCAAATCTGLDSTACGKIKSCKYAESTCSAAAACTGLNALSEPTCADSTYCVWTAENTTCAAVDCTKLDATEAACLGTKGCSLTPASGSCAKKGSNTSGGNGGSNTSGGDGGSNTSGGDGGSTGSAFGLKTSLTLLIIGFLL